MSKEIEVIDQYNGRHRFPHEDHYFEWRLKPGTIDIEGNEFLDVFRLVTDDEFELIATFPKPACVGVVTDNTMLVLPTRAENQQNRAVNRNGTSKLLGVCWDKAREKWHAQIKINGKKRRLGRYATEEEAHAAYCKAKAELHEFHPVPRKEPDNG